MAAITSLAAPLVQPLHEYVEEYARTLGLDPATATKRGAGATKAFLHWRWVDPSGGGPRNDFRITARRFGDNVELIALRRAGGSRYSTYVGWDGIRILLNKIDTTVTDLTDHMIRRAYMAGAEFVFPDRQPGALTQVTALRTFPRPHRGAVFEIAAGRVQPDYRTQGGFVAEVAPDLVQTEDSLAVAIKSEAFGTRVPAREKVTDVLVRVPRVERLVREGRISIAACAEATVEHLHLAPFMTWGKGFLANASLLIPPAATLLILGVVFSSFLEPQENPIV